MDLWATYLAAWLREQRAGRDTAVLDLNREMMIRNALPLMAPVQPGWWENAAAQAEVWKAQGWEVASAADLRTGKVTFRRLTA